eukprot:765818-Hanusia_phi.AAC.1
MNRMSSNTASASGQSGSAATTHAATPSVILSDSRLSRSSFKFFRTPSSASRIANRSQYRCSRWGPG